jgi:Zn-dependent peptidase ImmA (M78 family)
MIDNDRENREANLFAMCLLMPEKLVRSEVDKSGGIDLCDDEPIRELAKKFGVSISLMTIRLAQLYPRFGGL